MQNRITGSAGGSASGGKTHAMTTSKTVALLLPLWLCKGTKRTLASWWPWQVAQVQLCWLPQALDFEIKCMVVRWHVCVFK